VTAKSINNHLREMGLSEEEIFVIKATKFPNLCKTQIEVSKIIGMTKNTVKNAENRALAKMREELLASMGDHK